LVPSTDWKNLPIEASRIAAVLANDVDRLSFQRNLSESSHHQPVAFPPACRSFIALTCRKKKIHRHPVPTRCRDLTSTFVDRSARGR
jgi:hypothetical protein